MNALPEPLLGRQRIQQSGTMYDTGRILQRTADSTDSHNRPTYTYPPQTAVACGVYEAKNVEATDGEGNVVLVDYQVRLPYGTEITSQDRFEILTRHGAEFTAVVCEIVGQVMFGATAVVINCKVLTHG